MPFPAALMPPADACGYLLHFLSAATQADCKPGEDFSFSVLLLLYSDRGQTCTWFFRKVCLPEGPYTRYSLPPACHYMPPACFSAALLGGFSMDCLLPVCSACLALGCCWDLKFVFCYRVSPATLRMLSCPAASSWLLPLPARTADGLLPPAWTAVPVRTLTRPDRIPDHGSALWKQYCCLFLPPDCMPAVFCKLAPRSACYCGCYALNITPEKDKTWDSYGFDHAEDFPLYRRTMYDNIAPSGEHRVGTACLFCLSRTPLMHYALSALLL